MVTVTMAEKKEPCRQEGLPKIYLRCLASTLARALPSTAASVMLLSSPNHRARSSKGSSLNEDAKWGHHIPIETITTASNPLGITLTSVTPNPFETALLDPGKYGLPGV